MNIIDYEVLKNVCVNKNKSQRHISKHTGVSLGKVNKSLQTLKGNDYLDTDLQPTPTAINLFESLKPQSAIILAAGRGLRMIPLCMDIPKALLEVKGETLIERLIHQLHEVGVNNIYVVVGYMKENFEYLIDMYGVNLVVNTQFDNKNNLYSLSLVLDKINNSYIIPCDIYCENNPFSTIETYSWYMVTDNKNPSSNFTVNRNRELVFPDDNSIGNHEVGIAYICGDQTKYIKEQLSILRESDNTDFWETAIIKSKKSILSAKVVHHSTVYEINTYDDLIHCDVHSSSLNSKYIDIICDSLNIKDYPTSVQKIILIF